jgi:hypothetical protein
MPLRPTATLLGVVLGTCSTPACAQPSPSNATRAAPGERFGDALTQDYDAGKDVGMGVPLTVHGALFSGAGLLFMGATAVENDGNPLADWGLFGAIYVGLGLAQLIPGAVLIAGGREAKTDMDTPNRLAAYDAGFDHGLGRTLVMYGVPTLLVTLGAVSGAAGDVPALGALVVLPAAEVGYGAYAWHDGVSAGSSVRARPAPPMSAGQRRGAPPIYPLVHLEF